MARDRWVSDLPGAHCRRHRLRRRILGPMILKPDANQGPLLGTFITGPTGFVVGLIYGVVREWAQSGSSSPAA
jgi:hypothetical protein